MMSINIEETYQYIIPNKEIFIMFRQMMKGKIHKAVVTGANLSYEGSISVDPELLSLADILVNEKVMVANITNGQRFETYAIRGGPGEITLNGAAARLGEPGDRVIIITFGLYNDEDLLDFKPKIVIVDERNKPVNYS